METHNRVEEDEVIVFGRCVEIVVAASCQEPFWDVSSDSKGFEKGYHCGAKIDFQFRKVDRKNSLYRRKAASRSTRRESWDEIACWWLTVTDSKDKRWRCICLCWWTSKWWWQPAFKSGSQCGPRKLFRLPFRPWRQAFHTSCKLSRKDTTRDSLIWRKNNSLRWFLKPRASLSHPTDLRWWIIFLVLKAKYFLKKAPAWGTLLTICKIFYEVFRASCGPRHSRSKWILFFDFIKKYSFGFVEITFFILYKLEVKKSSIGLNKKLWVIWIFTEIYITWLAKQQ